MFTCQALTDFTPEDIAILIRACERGTFRVVAAMVMDGSTDDNIIHAREAAKEMDRLWAQECAERDAADRADYLAMNGLDYYDCTNCSDNGCNKCDPGYPELS